MFNEPGNASKKLQGAGKLTVEAIVGVTDLVESMHHTITSLGGILGEPNLARNKGFPGLVYNSIRTITELAGKGLGVFPLGQLSTMLGTGEAFPSTLAQYIEQVILVLYYVHVRL